MWCGKGEQSPAQIDGVQSDSKPRGRFYFPGGAQETLTTYRTFYNSTDRLCCEAWDVKWKFFGHVAENGFWRRMWGGRSDSC